MLIAGDDSPLLLVVGKLLIGGVRDSLDAFSAPTGLVFMEVGVSIAVSDVVDGAVVVVVVVVAVVVSITVSDVVVSAAGVLVIRVGAAGFGLGSRPAAPDGAVLSTPASTDSVG